MPNSLIRETRHNKSPCGDVHRRHGVIACFCGKCHRIKSDRQHCKYWKLNGNVGATYPNPAWGYYNDDDGKGISLDAVREALKHTETFPMAEWPLKQDMGEVHKCRYADGTALYNKGVNDEISQGGHSTVNSNIWDSYLQNGKLINTRAQDDQWNHWTKVKLGAGTYRVSWVMTKLGGSCSVRLKLGDDEVLKIGPAGGDSENGKVETFDNKKISWENETNAGLNGYKGGGMTFKLKNEMNVSYIAYCYNGSAAMYYEKIG